jgi:hypothetical protein
VPEKKTGEARKGASWSALGKAPMVKPGELFAQARAGIGDKFPVAENGKTHFEVVLTGGDDDHLLIEVRAKDSTQKLDLPRDKRTPVQVGGGKIRVALSIARSGPRQQSRHHGPRNHFHHAPAVSSGFELSATALTCASPMKLVVAIIFLVLAQLATADTTPLVLNAGRVHLGTPGSPEWDWFENDPARPGRLDLPFRATPNRSEATLLVRQDDVKEEWLVEVNGQRVGKLFLMEADLTHAIALPAGVLRDGDNVLSIIPPREKDDVILREIAIDARPLAEALHEATLEVTVEEPDHGALAARITIVDEQGALAPVIAAPGELLAVRPGVVYTGSGRARIGVRAGRYTVFASHGFEYGVASQQIEVRAGDSSPIVLRITREVATSGLVSCDTHIHTLTHSGHGDATVEERMLTLAGEGIELPIATEHNLHADYSEAAQRVGVATLFTPVIGNEVTTPTGHFNIFPIAPGRLRCPTRRSLSGHR